MSISSATIFTWTVQDDTDGKSTLVQVKAWCHYLTQFWPRSMSTYHITRPQWVKTTAKLSRPLFLSIKQCTIYDWGPPWPQSILLREPKALINTTNPSQICLKLKNSFLHNFVLNQSIIFKFCTEYDSITVIFCTKFQKALLTIITVKGKRVFSLRWISSGLWLLSQAPHHYSAGLG